MLEIEIWTGLQNKNMKTFQFVYEKYYNDLYKYGIRIITDEELVKDTIHDLFVSLYNRKTDFNTLSISIKPFLLSALKNKLYDSQKKVLFQEVLHVEAEVEAPIVELIIREEEAHANQFKLEKALQTLSERQREAIHLRYYENYSIAQIASMMEMNYQSVQNLLQRGIKSLAQQISLLTIIGSSLLFVCFFPMLIFNQYRLKLIKVLTIK